MRTRPARTTSARGRIATCTKRRSSRTRPAAPAAARASSRGVLHVFDRAASSIKPTQVAFFDTWPEDDNTNYNGLWNNYPYFASGTVIGSDIEKGLFVWWVGTPQIAFSFPQGLPTTIN